MGMKRLTLAVAALALSCSLAVPALAQQSMETAAPTPAASPEVIPSPVPASESPAMHALAIRQFLAWQNDDVNRAQYGDSFGSQLTDSFLSDASAQLAQLGGLQKATFLGISHTAEHGDLYVYRMDCQHGSVDMDFSMQADGRIGYVFFQS